KLSLTKTWLSDTPEAMEKVDLRRWPCFPGAVVLFTCMTANAIFASFIGSATNPLLASLWFSLLVALLFPFSGAAAFFLGKKIRPEKHNALADKQTGSPVARVTNTIAASTRGFLTQAYPYLSARFGFTSLCVLASFLPNGVGMTIASWLHASA